MFIYASVETKTLQPVRSVDVENVHALSFGNQSEMYSGALGTQIFAANAVDERSANKGISMFSLN